MSPASPKFFLTTPIYYVNARPHIGHAYTTIVADVIARRSRAQGVDTWFLTGTDEHGQKIERSAAAAGMPPQEFTDQVSATFREPWRRMGITNDDFIRTTEPRHKQGVQKLFTTLEQNGFIDLQTYTGAYCVSDETFVDVEPGAPCPECGNLTEVLSESNFYFKLSAFQQKILDLIQSNELVIQPDTLRNEVLSFVRGDFVAELRKFSDDDAKTPDGYLTLTKQAIESGRLKQSASGATYVPGALKDLSISRTSIKWGVPVPGHEGHVIYVWLDALANYMTAVGYGSDAPEDIAKFARYWPADLHLIGKEIARFHCVYWPAFLLAANLPLPKKIAANGWLLFHDSKMSKSRGNVVRIETILDAFGTLCPPSPPQNSVILSGAQGAESKDPEAADITSAAQTFPTSNSVLLKGTASAVPNNSPENYGALAPEVPSSLAPEQTVPQRLKPENEDGGSGTAEAVPLSDAPSKAQQDLFASDVLRYFLLREIPFGQDGNFSLEAMVTRYNADLVNSYGNLVKRTLTQIDDRLDGLLPRLPDYSSTTDKLADFDFNGLIFVSFPTDEQYVVAIGDRMGHVVLGLDARGVVVDTLGVIDKGSSSVSSEIFKIISELAFAAAKEFFGMGKYNSGLETIQSVITFSNKLLAFVAPWKRNLEISQDALAIKDVLSSVSESIRIITALLYPILPYATASVWRQLGLGDIEVAAHTGQLKDLQWGGLKPGTRLGPLAPVFPRADKGLTAIMMQMEQDQNTPISHANAHHDAATSTLSEFPETSLASATAAQVATFDPAAPPRTTTLAEPNPGAQVAASNAATTERTLPPSHTEAHASGIFAAEAAASAPQTIAQIGIEDFAKIELRVAKIVVAERIPKADKLLRLEVDLGTERRQILSGIAEWYTPEDLIGRRIVVITNLAPRTMRGLESHGMLLAASTEGGKPYLATFGESDDLPLGARLK